MGKILKLAYNNGLSRNIKMICISTTQEECQEDESVTADVKEEAASLLGLNVSTPPESTATAASESS